MIKKFMQRKRGEGLSCYLTGLLAGKAGKMPKGFTMGVFYFC